MGHVNENDLEWTDYEHGDTRFRRKLLAAATDGEQLGASLYEIPPGAKSWPYHYHTSNEEAVYVLAGSGSIRLDGERLPLEAGDYVALPADESGGHQVINDSDDDLLFLMTSTMHDPEVVRYTDSEKVGVMTGAPPGVQEGRTFTAYFREGTDVDYWEGEE